MKFGIFASKTKEYFIDLYRLQAHSWILKKNIAAKQISNIASFDRLLSVFDTDFTYGVI